jgi:hypothetical protein
VSTVFDEYVFFGEQEEIERTGEQNGSELTHYAMLTDAEKKQNEKKRTACMLMGCDPHYPQTRVDLALHSENKLFMAHRATQEFLDSMWSANSANGQWLDSMIQVSPSQKFWM